MGSIIHLIGAIAAVWVYRDAKSKGHSILNALLWAAGNIAFVLIFFPMYLLVGRRQQMPSNRTEEERRLDEITIDAEAEFVGNTVDCPMCARKVKEDYKLCPYCGFSLKPQCENCGADLERHWKVCPSCQTEVKGK